MKSHKAWMAPIFSCMIVAGISGSAEAASLIVNGGFETGSFGTSWTLGGDTSVSGVGSGAAHSGTFEADLSTITNVSTDVVTLSQSVATTAGQQYLLTFWLQNDAAGPNAFNVSFGGTPITGGGLPILNANAFGYSEYSALVTASTAASILLFTVNDGPGEFNLDDVSLTATPLPAALPLFGAGLGLMGMLGWRKKRKSKVLPA